MRGAVAEEKKCREEPIMYQSQAQPSLALTLTHSLIHAETAEQDILCIGLVTGR